MATVTELASTLGVNPKELRKHLREVTPPQNYPHQKGQRWGDIPPELCAEISSDMLRLKAVKAEREEERKYLREAEAEEKRLRVEARERKRKGVIERQLKGG